MIYVALDGDDIGNDIRRYFLENDEEKIAQKSNEVVHITSKITSYLQDQNFVIVFCAGDDILSKGDLIDETKLSNFLSLFKTKCTFSVGIGNSLEKTYIALRYAKSIGKNKIVRYSENGQLEVFDGKKEL